MTNEPHTVADLMLEAARALANRDPERLEDLERTARNWMQTGLELNAQLAMLHTMAEAAELLHDQPSDTGWDASDEDEDA